MLTEAGARWVVDTVACRPGHPQLLAQLPDRHWTVGLPGNPSTAHPVGGHRPAILRGAALAGALAAVAADWGPDSPHLCSFTTEAEGLRTCRA
ncbi:hypothetical protein [Streptomyces sp. 2131.1]|uniref:hypothetical protein n=1 Tax=Streptomyces sp. 2131.1 TaxID=1855346 RepID=UPI000A7C5530|nr:hypothetical protein [Streptomyces sp. 2131.1]